MNTTHTITIGWTQHPDRPTDYTPFADTYRPGQPQHTETITVELPDELFGQRLAEAVFVASNAPSVEPGSPQATILEAIRATGYTGREAHWSLSVGDTVTTDGATWAVEQFGWALVTEDQKKRAEAVEWATQEFNMVWQNDQDVYLAVVAMVREQVRRVSGITDQTIGRNVKDRVFAWAFGGGWGYSTGWPNPHTFDYFLDRDQYGNVREEVVGEEARDALGLEGYDPETGLVV